MCDSCADERGVTDPTGFSLGNLFPVEAINSQGINLKDLSNGNESDADSPTSADHSGHEAACSECGFTMDDFQKVRRFGCGNCYRVFAVELGQMLRGMHKGPKHLGKVPKGLAETHAKHAKLKELRGELEQAIASESYEDAAKLRDAIHKVSQEGVSQ